MSTPLQYTKKPGQSVVAVRLDLETDGFTYEKWGATQTCKRGDWLVDNDGDVYSVDHESFEATYTPLGGGRYAKTSPVWAEVAEEDGVVETAEGVTHFKAGDYLVSNRADGTDRYAVSRATFLDMYERVT